MPAPDPRHAGQTSTGVVAVLLAAGAGSRYRDIGHKLQAVLPASGSDPAGTVLERAVAHVLAAEVGPVVVVTGAIDPPLPAGVIRRHNPDWASGQASSVHAGIDAARELGAGAVVIGLADQPAVSVAAWRQVAAAPGPIAVATYGGRRRNPVKLEASIWGLVPQSGDEGARSLLRVRPELVREVPCTGSPADIDTVEDLRRWQTS